MKLVSGDARVRVEDLSRRARNRYLEETRRRNLGGAYAYVSEYPKSGGTWVKNMLDGVAARDASRRRGPVIHNHWLHRQTFRPVIYVIRDGRDIAVSFYFHHVRHTRGPVKSRRILRYFDQILGRGHDPDDIRTNLPAFIDSLATHPLGGLARSAREHRFATWPDHVADWADHQHVLVVRYEHMLEDATAQLGRMVDHLGAELDGGAAEEIARAQSFQALSGRPPGIEDASSFYRKGIAGDWRNHFTVATGEAFVRFAGRTLVELGYESSDAWLEALPPV